MKVSLVDKTEARNYGIGIVLCTVLVLVSVLTSCNVILPTAGQVIYEGGASFEEVGYAILADIEGWIQVIGALFAGTLGG